MKTIVVVAGNRSQFNDYVQTTKDRRITYKSDLNKTIFEGVMFLYICHEAQLRGRDLGEDAELVFVGTWYSLEQEMLKKIKKQFLARKR